MRFFQNLQLAQKFTLILMLVFVGGIVASGIALSTVLTRNAQAHLTNNAVMLMETMNSVREYTSSQVQPELVDRLNTEFLPETVPAYSAREVFEVFRVHPDYSEFFYKEATLNPTNLRDKADEFEAQIVERFRQEDFSGQVSGFRDTPAGEIYYIARPIRVSKESCLECHSSPSVAPATMIERYGSANGFDWSLNEIVGAQVISVPAERVLSAARQSLVLILGIFIAAFAIAIFLVNFWLKRYVVRPINRMVMTAEAVSMGDTAAEFTQTSNDEVGKLADAFNRMRTSLQMAMQRLDRYREGRRSSGGPDSMA
ncbi:histidine kinase [filamentous cyanobacterium CCP5]|nr:histidine kinase [filamentous cyanobacterium CCP5]